MATEVFTTSDGREIPLRPVSSLYLARIQAKHEIPPPPTYTAQLVGGGTQTFDHDETTLETAEDHRIWNQYKDDLSEALANRMKDVTQFLFYYGIGLDPPPLEEWSVDFEEWDIEPPDPLDKKRFKQEWIEGELVPDKDDLAALMARLYVRAGLVTDKQEENVERFFRLALARLTAG